MNYYGGSPELDWLPFPGCSILFLPAPESEVSWRIPKEWAPFRSPV
jgi:hypothetical protein